MNYNFTRRKLDCVTCKELLAAKDENYVYVKDISDFFSTPAYSNKKNMVIINNCDSIDGSKICRSWESLESLRYYIRRLDSGDPVNYLCGFLKSGKDFINNMDLEMRQLFTLINIDYKEPSFANLNSIDLVIHKIYNPITGLNPSAFTPLVAYLGEAVRHTVHGKWMLVEEGDEIWEPFISAGDDWFPVAYQIYVQLVDKPLDDARLEFIANNVLMHPMRPPPELRRDEPQ